MAEGPNKHRRRITRDPFTPSGIRRIIQDMQGDNRGLTHRKAKAGSNPGAGPASVSDMEAKRRNTNTAATDRRKKVKQRKGVVAKASKTRGMKHPSSQGLSMTPRNIRKANKKKK